MRPHAPPSPALSNCISIKLEDTFGDSYDSISHIMSQSIGHDPLYDIGSKYNSSNIRMQSQAVNQNPNYTSSLRFSPQPSIYSDDGNASKGYPYATPMASPPMPPSITTNPIISRPNLRSHSRPTAKSGARAGSGAAATVVPSRGGTLSGRIEKSPSSKKRPTKKARGCTSRAPTRPVEQIKVPLSKLAKQYPNIHIADISSFIVRDESERHDEIQRGKSPGKVKRPMNAFMLYRKAYQNVAKAYYTGDNHQVVSAVCGRSWAIESPSIKEKFISWATIERGNHQLAYPGYKFAPGKMLAKTDDIPDIPEEDEDCDADGEVDDEIDAMEDIVIVEELPPKKRLDRQQKQAKKPVLVVSTSKINQPQILKPVRPMVIRKSNADDKDDNNTANNAAINSSAENNQNDIFTTVAPQQHFYYGGQEPQVSNYPMHGIDPIADSFSHSIYPPNLVNGRYDQNMYTPAKASMNVAAAAPTATVDKSGFMLLPDDMSMQMTAWNSAGVNGAAVAVADPAPAPVMDESLFDQAWVYPYGQDSMTMLDSMMNIDPQMSYLTSSWVQDDTNVADFV